jgi:hypothetical protein
MPDELRATGIEDAIISDVLLGLDVPDPLSPTRDQQLAIIHKAIEDSRVSERQVDALRRMGLISN